jgi:orotate phosphoribosyltransferase
VITVVDRLEGAAETFKAAGVPFTAILTAADFR